MKVAFAAAAEAALEEIGDYIARDDPRRALTFVRELRVAALEIATMPRAFPLVARYEHIGLRRKRHGRYLIFYRVEAARIVIVHIMHGARDIEALLPGQADPLPDPA